MQIFEESTSLLTQDAALALVKHAWIMVVKHREAKLRFGQALWNLLPEHLCQRFTGTEYDFFYKPQNEAVDLFYKHYVSQSV